MVMGSPEGVDIRYGVHMTLFYSCLTTFSKHNKGQSKTPNIQEQPIQRDLSGAVHKVTCGHRLLTLEGPSLGPFR